MNESVLKVLRENIWYISTFSDEPNVVPVGFKDVDPEGNLEIGAVLLETTVNNIKENGRIAIAAADPKTMEAYQIKGRAEIVTEGPLFEKYADMAQKVFKGTMAAKCAIKVYPEHLIVAGPNPKNKEELPL